MLPVGSRLVIQQAANGKSKMLRVNDFAQQAKSEAVCLLLLLQRVVQMQMQMQNGSKE